VAPKVELLWWDGCPSFPAALELVSREMAAAGLDPATLVVTQIRDEADAGREAFVGSPTVRVNGRDIQPPGPDEPLGLSCRVYHLRDGRVSPVPDPADVREALAA
jgi:hypothetical protein